MFLIMAHCGTESLGALLLNDPAFCREIFAILRAISVKRLRRFVAAILPTRYKATLILSPIYAIRTFLVPPIVFYWKEATAPYRRHGTRMHTALSVIDTADIS